jgi:pyrroloquinoline quinone biosynthesis protein B
MIEYQHHSIKAIILGIMQDAGLPHAGCLCHRCRAAYADPVLKEYATSLAIVDTRQDQSKVWLIDASPDIREQINILADVLGPNSSLPGRLRQPDGIFLTHAHFGHTAGLMHLGPEAMDVQHLPIYCSKGLVEVLRQSRLWRPLINNLDLFPLDPFQRFEIASDLYIDSLPVPHRDELGTDTFAYRITGPNKTLIYIPDIDDWNLWPEAREFLNATDIALVDASFFSEDELGGRAPVAHPLVMDTLQFFDQLPVQLWLTHFNHTNPVLDPNGDARRQVISAGGKIAYTRKVFDL